MSNVSVLAGMVYATSTSWTNDSAWRSMRVTKASSCSTLTGCDRCAFACAKQLSVEVSHPSMTWTSDGTPVVDEVSTPTAGEAPHASCATASVQVTSGIVPDCDPKSSANMRGVSATSTSNTSALHPPASAVNPA